jgi:mannose-6-phosphate isomerase-like protein (cupin superfamily)
MHKINIAEKFSKISEYYKPHIAGELNGQMVKLVKANTEFVWHHHDNEDEMFLVVKGRVDRDWRVHHRPPAASSIAPSPKRKSGSCSSNPRPR